MKRSLTKLKDGQHPEVSSGLRIRSSDKFIIAIVNISSVFHFIIALITITLNRELVGIGAGAVQDFGGLWAAGSRRCS